MKHGTFAVVLAVSLAMFMGLCALTQWRWEQDCAWQTARETPVYTPGTAEVATTLPAGAAVRAEDTVGDVWLAIEYMVGGQRHAGMVRSDSVVAAGK